MKRKIAVILMSLIGLVVFLNSCRENKAENVEKPDGINKIFLKNVKTIKSGLSNEITELTLTGKIDYDPDKVVNYVPLVNGIVERVYFSMGDKVQKGQKLIDFRSTELSSLYSDFVILESEYLIAERELDRVKSLYEDNMLPEKDYIEAQSKLKQLKASLQKIRGDMAMFDIDDESGTFYIKSPMSGFIVDKNITSGSTISPGSEPLFTIADLSTVWVIANVYAKDLTFVKEGADVTFTTLSYPDEVFYGKINSVSQVFDPEEKTLKARIIMKNEELKFKPEMSALIMLKNENNYRFVSIPTDAIIFDNNNYYVVVEKSQEDFEIKEVTVHGHRKDTTYISSGLAENENIVVKNQLLIYSGLNDK